MKTFITQISRRRFAAGATGFALMVARPRTVAQQPSMEEKQPTSANSLRTSLHQQLEFSAPPRRVADVLLDSIAFAAMTGMPATIDRSPGGAFKTFGGLIEGRNIEIVADSRIVQAWRPTSWDPGIYSIVHFELRTSGRGTALTLDHTGFPEGDFDHLDAGWHTRYWEPLKKYLSRG